MVTVAETTSATEGTADDGRYRVRSGESLSLIAQRLGLTLDAMLRANPRVEPNRIFAGQWLAVPQPGGGS